MKKSRTKRLLPLFGLLALAIGLPVCLVELEVRQERLNQVMLAALRNGDGDGVRAALKRGADPFAVVFWFGDYPGDTSPWQRMLERWDDTLHNHRKTDPNGRPALATAFYLENRDIALALLQQGVKPDNIPVNADGTTDLMYAAQKGDTAMVQMLLQHGAEVGLTDGFKETALSYAMKKKHPEIVALLRKAGENR